MTKKLQIFSFPDKNPEYLQLQIDSFTKYMKSDEVEFVVINASNNFKDEVEEICNKNSVRCIQYTGKRDVPWSHYYVEQLNWFRDEVQSKTDDYIMLIHSDMFFVNKLDYKKLLKNKKLYLNPQYRNLNKGYNPPNDYKYFYMWDGVVLLDSEFFNKENLTRLFDWDYLPVSDVGGKTYKLLESLDKSVFGIFEFWNFGEEAGDSIDTHLNGNVRILVNSRTKKLKVFATNSEYTHGKLLPYESEKEDYGSYYSEKILSIKEVFIEKFKFPNPPSVDLIQVMDESIENAPIIHLKSGSRSYDTNYISAKVDAIRNLIYRKD